MGLIRSLTLLTYLALVSGQKRPIHNRDPIVKMDGGLMVRGSVATASNGREYFSFRGIPYGVPPVGPMRFKDPKSAEPWSGILNTTEFGPSCIQYDPVSRKIIGDEDCLYINVYTPYLPKHKNQKLMPVLVYIHGGVYVFGGSEQHSPENLMNVDMVVVTMNYRLGPIGFLSTGDKVISGNLGLKDQSLCLKLVQENVRAFGGDPDNVTLMGHASVTYHMLSPMSKGTFKRAIALSGSCLNPWALQTNPVDNARKLGRILNCDFSTNTELADSLRNARASDIVLAQLKMSDLKENYLFTPFGPTIEYGHSSFLTQHPRTAILNGQMQKVPLVVSSTAQDGLYPAAAYLRPNDHTLDLLEHNWRELFSTIFLLPSKNDRVADKIREKYFGDQKICKKTFHLLVKALTDRQFAAGAAELALLQASVSDQSVYGIRFNYPSSINFASLLAHRNITLGAGHADDILLYFPSYGLKPTTNDDIAMRDQLVNVVYNFAATGNLCIPDYPNFTWSPVTPGSNVYDYLEIYSAKDAAMNRDADFGNLKFWKSIE